MEVIPPTEQHLPLRSAAHRPARSAGLCINEEGLLIDEKTGEVINEYQVRSRTVPGRVARAGRLPAVARSDTCASARYRSDVLRELSLPFFLSGHAV